MPVIIEATPVQGKFDFFREKQDGIRRTAKASGLHRKDDHKNEISKQAGASSRRWPQADCADCCAADCPGDYRRHFASRFILKFQLQSRILLWLRKGTNNGNDKRAVPNEFYSFGTALLCYEL